MIFETIEAAMETMQPGDKVVSNGNGRYIVESAPFPRGELASGSAPRSHSAPVPSRAMTGRQDGGVDWGAAQTMTFGQRAAEDVHQARENGGSAGPVKTAVAALHRRGIIR